MRAEAHDDDCDDVDVLPHGRENERVCDRVSRLYSLRVGRWSGRVEKIANKQVRKSAPQHDIFVLARSARARDCSHLRIATRHPTSRA